MSKQNYNNEELTKRDLYNYLFQKSEEHIRIFFGHHFKAGDEENKDPDLLKEFLDIASLNIHKCIEKNNLERAKNLLKIFLDYKLTEETSGFTVSTTPKTQEIFESILAEVTNARLQTHQEVAEVGIECLTETEVYS